MEGFVKTATVAKALGISPSAVRTWAERGVIPAMRPVPNMYLFDLKAVLEAVKATAKQTPPAE